ncbi:hypothetical protein ACAG25_08845 [Mycobacterium sp. pV006]|uniref:hypothetical protein n=1 Tax=Mycobacterium sp. pV006 TaxID=3238983 RepID=UPI00351B0FC4
MSFVKTAAAGALLGGGMLFTAGVGMAGAQPAVPTPDGLVDIAVGDVTILRGVPADAAAVTAGALCGTAPEEVGALAQQVDSESVAQTVCAGLPGGDLVLTQNVSSTQEQPSTTDGSGEGTTGSAESETGSAEGATEGTEGANEGSGTVEDGTTSPGTAG